MAMVSNSSSSFPKTQMPQSQILCRKKEKDKGGQNHQPYKVIEITPPPKNLGIRCFPSVQKTCNTNIAALNIRIEIFAGHTKKERSFLKNEGEAKIGVI
ncbi:PREDICTED: uncharacterized protein LOC109190589 isoform X2 [Ipomoea nil]|uniref:uncharacterized protein LOC109190589 isoform X2 n=1 Tax=Ipomoea nil TaxID=35883 RepID=UPI000900E9D3|nr:PREDICTED: uncharacterized protein LOC109190589 isoform X2 [Ipomoea nil]